MKLFKVVCRLGTVTYFESKQDAKAWRNLLHSRDDQAAVINRGPDHWRGETF